MLTIMERKTGESARDYVTRVLIDNIVNVHLERAARREPHAVPGGGTCACGAAARAYKAEERHLCVVYRFEAGRGSAAPAQYCGDRAGAHGMRPSDGGGSGCAA